ncbi:hypothetical protein APY03_4834 [Variovorax sp. WDL1]|nr:hypothetical protein APY03_4834 [Variovorax sp. WDL1]
MACARRPLPQRPVGARGLRLASPAGTRSQELNADIARRG